MVKRDGDRYVVGLPSGEVELKDEREYLEYFADGKDIIGFLSDESVFGEDLTAYAGLAEAVGENVAKIRKGISLI
jgi:hypothetical protein